MPGWQQFYKQYGGSDFEIVSVAVDVQGADRAGPWVKKSGATFTTLVDSEATLGARFGLNYVPFSILIDETGRMVREPQYVNVADDAQRAAIADWIEKGNESLSRAKPAKTSDAASFASAEAKLRFSRAALLLQLGRTRDAATELKRALIRDPDNWLIRKQIWAIEHPERFYEGDVDFGWQQEQLKRERRTDKHEGS